MKPFGRTTRNALLAFHVLFSAVWIGGVASLILVSLVARAPRTDETLATVRTALRWVDWVLIIPACLGSLATGFLFSLGTQWGFFKHYWVLIKWVLTVAMIAFGIVCLGPWVDESARLAAERGVAALHDGTYAALYQRIVWFGALQIVLLVTMIFLSSFKPFGKRGDRAKPRPPAH